MVILRVNAFFRRNLERNAIGEVLILIALVICHQMVGDAEHGARSPRSSWTVVGLAGRGVTGFMGEGTEVQTGNDQFSCVGWLHLAAAEAERDTSGGRKRPSSTDASKTPLVTPTPGLILWRLTDGCQPIPYAHWRFKDILVHVTFFCAQIDGRPVNIARWSLYNEGKRAHDVRFFVAIRPSAVTGGFSPIRSFAAQDHSHGLVLQVNHRDAIVTLERPDDYGAIAGADVHDFALRGEVPKARSLTSQDGRINAAMRFEKTIGPRQTVPLDFLFPVPGDRDESSDGPDASAWANRLASTNVLTEYERTVARSCPSENFPVYVRCTYSNSVFASNPGLIF